MDEENLPAGEAEMGAEAIAAAPEIENEAPATFRGETAASPVNEQSAEAAPQAGQEPFWYRKTLREYEKKNKALEKQLEQVKQAQEQAYPQHHVPDLYEDPQGFQQAMMAQMQQFAVNQRLDQSEWRARDRHGDELVDEVLAWAETRPDIAQWSLSQRDPYAAAIQVYQRERLAAEIGDNPEVWRQKERERLRQEILNEAQSVQGQQQVSIPRSLGSARNVAPSTPPVSDKPVFLKDIKRSS